MASQHVTIKHTKRMGRALVSTKRIAPGTVLLQAPATGDSVVLLDHLVGERCDVCLADISTRPCGNTACSAVICSQCSLDTHASTCGAASREPVLVRSLLRVAAAERRRPAVRKQLDALENHHDAYGRARRDAFAAAAARAAALGGGDARRLARHAAALESNEFGVSETDRWAHAPLELGEESVGCGLFVDAAPANHSCAPNCDPVVLIEAGRAPLLHLVARRAIEADHQVFIAYVPLYASGTQRRAALRDTYRFECACERCRAEQRAGTPAAAVQRAMAGRLCACGGLLRRPACVRCGWRGRPTPAHAAAAAGLARALAAAHGGGSAAAFDALERRDAAAAPYLHAFHALRHAARVTNLGRAVLRGDGVAAAAAAVEKLLKRAQIGDEFAPWVATLRSLSAPAPKRRRTSSSS